DEVGGGHDPPDGNQLRVYYRRALLVPAVRELHHAVAQREQGEVTTHADAAAGVDHGADLAHDHLARAHGFAAVDLGPAALRVAVAAVPGAALSLLVRHGSGLDRLDAHAGVVLPVALAQPIALAALVLEDADLRAGRVAFDLGQHLRARDQ